MFSSMYSQLYFYFFVGGGGGGGGRYSRPARVCFSGFVLNRVSNLSFFVLIGVSIYQFLS